MEKYKSQTREAYFAAANGRDGFYSYFKECFDRPEIEKLYVIKGAPGTGKSKFMNDVSALAEAKGGYVKYYYCSSDPNSLDGVIARTESGAVAILDGTAPHNRDAVIPGAIDEIANLGDAFDSDKLKIDKQKIYV